MVGRTTASRWHDGISLGVIAVFFGGYLWVAFRMSEFEVYMTDGLDWYAGDVSWWIFRLGLGLAVLATTASAMPLIGEGIGPIAVATLAGIGTGIAVAIAWYDLCEVVNRTSFLAYRYGVSEPTARCVMVGGFAAAFWTIVLLVEQHTRRAPVDSSRGEMEVTTSRA